MPIPCGDKHSTSFFPTSHYGQWGSHQLSHRLPVRWLRGWVPRAQWEASGLASGEGHLDGSHSLLKDTPRSSLLLP